ncbi:DHHA1 domain-containing protein [Mycoplasma struthionis]|uniref:DHHA1 domain-containing protein n=1 Tax=Mycoplasma struthionis TaxID=538220 RepID=UPI0021BD394B|nr:DHHA1 domain-containing protein [Mycoplasma struthionis]
MKIFKKENIIVLDHHRITKNPDFAYHENLYIDSFASSASEIVTEIIAITNNQDKIDELTAQLLLNGIYLDTNTFQKQTTAKTFNAASILQEWGAKILVSVNTLKMQEEVYKVVKELISSMQEVKPGYFLAYKNIETSTDIISMAADEILRVNGRKAVFVVAKLSGTKKCKMSARGINTNVQIIAEAVNGGGHYGTAAAETSEPIELFVDNIKQAIVSVKDESNNN